MEKQGENYEEEESINEESPKGISEIPKPILIAIIAFIAIIAILIIANIVQKSNKKKDNEVVETEDVIDEEWAKVIAENEGVDTAVENADESEYVSYGSYTEDEIKELRAYGYTGDEIEFYEQAGKDSSELIAEAKKDIEKVQEKVIRELSDTGSEAYQKLVKMTWLVGKKITLKKVKEDDTEAVVEYQDFVENCDYVKCEPRGKQLFIRVTLDDGTKAFMMVPPERWVDMKEKGNIVISYTQENYNGTKIITNIVEKEPEE